MAVTMQTVETALKTVYKGPIVDQINTEADPFIDKIHKDTSRVNVNNEIVRAAEVGLNGGFGAGTETGELPAPGENIYKNLKSTTKNLFGTLQISDKMIRGSKSGTDKNKFVDLLQREIDKLVKTAKWHYARQVSGSHMGILTTCKAGSSSNIIGVNDRRLLMEGITIDILNADGSEVASKRRILNIDRSKDQITITGTPVAVSGDMIVTVQGSYGLELTGLGDLFDLDAERLYGNERATNSWLNPRVVKNVGAISDVLMHDIISEQEDDFNVNLNYIRAGSDAYKSYIKYFEERKRLVNTTEIKGGVSAISFDGRAIYRDKFMQSDAIDFLDPDKFYLDQVDEWDWLTNESGNILIKIGRTPVYEASLAKYADLLCVVPGGMARITGVTDPV